MKTDKKVFQSACGPILESDIIAAFQLAGVSKGDTVMVHSRLFSLGKLAEITDRSELLALIINALLLAVGSKGTIIFPAFTFAFCRTGIFDLSNSRSEMGALSEEARKWQKTVRTSHPIYSVAIMGYNAHRFLIADNGTCFGKNSIFDLLHKENMDSGKIKILTLGIDVPPGAITYIHYLEEKMKVSYRYHKQFSGKIIDAQEERAVKTNFFVRHLDVDVVFDEEACWQLWIDHNISSSQKLGDSFIHLFKEKDIHDVTLAAITAKPDFLCKGGYNNATV